MKNIDIYVDGKYYITDEIENWIYYMSYKDAVIKRVGQINEKGEYKRVLLQALYKSLEHILEPCSITVYSKIELGFNKPKKSRNKDIIIRILTAVNKAGHKIRFRVDNKFEQVDIWEEKYGNQNSNIGHSQNTIIPDIKGKITPNDVFKQNNIVDDHQEQLRKEWEELLNDNHSAWVPGSGGY